MPIHHFHPTSYSNVMGGRPAVLTVAPGDTVITQTLDAAGTDHEGAQRAPRGNPMTGPFAIEGAEPGDALLVTVERMTPTRATGWTYSPVSAQVVEPRMVAELAKSTRFEWAIDAEAGTVALIGASERVSGWRFPLMPMLGCFGVAPERGQAISTATSGPYGGNMDYRAFGPGATIAFPVSEPGGLLFLGDGHACQGDGEIVGTGIETSFEVEFTLNLRKKASGQWPRCETATDVMTLASGRPLDQALQSATSEMIRWLVEDLGIDAVEASHLLGQMVRYDVANVFNPAYCVACRLPKNEITRGLSLLR
ncbi:acetamidase [Bosea sp. Root381]|uniref:acetamidase/formamidase family protein n=1 Tax=Bosea sp. Root381 TaxID=1736524 RepID=UPI0006FF274B|nr:acetamidase/formamidase family protein [Bosea sp. Root381]KRE18146.1 acetamidase [Bosea sp. Root381]